MSAAAVQRVVVRMLYDPALVEAVYADAATALADVDVSAAERAWLTAADPRRWRADPMRRSRGLTAVLEEFPTAGALAARARGVAALDGFFSSAAFHRCVQRGGSLAPTFGAWLARWGGAVEAMAVIEGGIARVRRAPTVEASEAVEPQAARWMTAPSAWGAMVPGGAVAGWQAMTARLAAHPDGPLGAVVDFDFEVPTLALRADAPEGVIAERTPGGVGLAEAPASLARLLAALEQPRGWGEVVTLLRALGAEPGEEAELVGELADDGLLRAEAAPADEGDC